MATLETTEHFSEPYQQQLLDLAQESLSQDEAQAIVEQLGDWRAAASSTQPDESIPYVRVGSASEHRPILYVPGFTEGIEAKAPFAVELAKRGAEIILPGQNRKEILKEAVTDKRDATYSQAMNYLDVLRAEGSPQVDVVTHSYGSLIFDAMHKIAEAEGLDCFGGSKVAMLAPAGLNAKENIAKLAGRFTHGMIAENFTDKDFPDETGEMFKAGAANFAANIPRGLREILEIAKRKVDYTRLLSSDIGGLAVVGYAEDAVFPGRVLRRSMQDMFEGWTDENAGVVWVTPYAADRLDAAGQPRGGHDASHNDEQFNPSRVAATTLGVLGRG